MKHTKSREQIYEVLKMAQYPISADEIFKHLEASDVTLSTIYRTLKTFVKEGIIKKEIDQTNKAVFLLLKQVHNHVLICQKCNKEQILKECPYHKINDKIQKETGFVVNDQNTIIYGICKDCKSKTES